KWCYDYKERIQNQVESTFCLKELRDINDCFDLKLVIEVGIEGGWAKCNLLYNSAALMAIEAKQIARQFATVFRNCTFDPEQKLEEISLLDKAERETVCYEWNRTEAKMSGKSVAELFEEQVKKAPEAVALESEGEQVTYEGLNRRANRL